MRQVSDRQLKRVLNSKYPGRPYIQIKKEVVDGNQIWLFVNVKGRHIGIIDRGTYLALHDTQNPNDTAENPTERLSKGKHIRAL